MWDEINDPYPTETDLKSKGGDDTEKVISEGWIVG